MDKAFGQGVPVCRDTLPFVNSAFARQGRGDANDLRLLAAKREIGGNLGAAQDLSGKRQ
jgi:hypothetical protein